MNNTPQNMDVSSVRLRRPERMQMTMQTQCVDDLIPPDHQVRVIWQVVDAMDLSPFLVFTKAREGVGGRDTTDPRLLVCLWLHATLRGIGSARQLARQCVDNAPFRWLCGGVSINHHTLSDFRVQHEAALDDLFTRTIATLVDKGLVSVQRIAQDGTRVRASAGAGSFRRQERLEKLLAEAREHVTQVKALMDDPAQAAALSARQKAARQRAAQEREERVRQAIEQLPELEQRQAERAKTVSKKDKAAGKIKEPRASTTDPDTRVMKMGDGGFRPALNMQFAADTASRAIVGVEVLNVGVDSGQAEPMRQQVERRTGRTVGEHLVDGGYLTFDEIDRAAEQDVKLYVPPKPPRNPAQCGDASAPRPGDSEAVKQWRQHMSSEEAKSIYKQRAATIETINADAKTHRGLGRLLVRGVEKAKCVALWFALAYNLMHFGSQMIA